MFPAPGNQARLAVKDVLHYLQNRAAYVRPVPRVSYADRLLARAAEKGVKYGRIRTHKKKYQCIGDERASAR